MFGDCRHREAVISWCIVRHLRQRGYRDIGATPSRKSWGLSVEVATFLLLADGSRVRAGEERMLARVEHPGAQVAATAFGFGLRRDSAPAASA